MSGPVVLVLGPAVGAVVAWLVGRWPRLTVAAGTLFAWGLALWLRVLADNEQVIVVYGRFLTLTPGIQSLFGVLFVGLGLLFLLSLLWPQGRYFVPASLAAIAALAAALLVRPLTLSALLWLAAAVFLGIVIQSGQAGQTQGAWRYVLMVFLAVLLLLAGGWMAETGQTGLQEVAGRLLAVAFMILLAGFPFHIWLQPVVTAVSDFDRASSDSMERGSRSGLALVLVLGLGQLVLMVFIYEWLAAYPWLGQLASFRRLVVWSSGLTALMAGILALTASSLRRLLGSLLLLDMSVSTALLLVLAAGWETAVLLPTARTVSLLLVFLGWHSLAQDDLSGANWQGAGRRRPAAALVFGFGLLSLLGLPLTPGFPGRWAAVAFIAGEVDVSFWLPASLLLAMGGGILGVWRGLGPLLQREEATAVPPRTTGLWVGLLAGLLAGFSLAAAPYGLGIVQRLASQWLNIG